SLGLLIKRAVAALGQRQPAALGGNRAALDAVGGGDVDVYLGGAVFELVLGDLVDLGRAHRDPGLGYLARDLGLDADVVGGVVAGGVAGEEDGVELVEGQLVVGLGVLRPRAALEYRDLGVVLDLPVPTGGGAFGGDHRRTHRAAEDQALGQRLLHVARAVEVLLDHRAANLL